MASLTMGFIGVGGIGGMHGNGLRARPDLFRMQAVADVNAAGAGKFADEFGIPDRHADYRKLLDDRRIDAVIVLLPHFLHEQACVAALEAGKHVLVEKPIARTLDEADRIIAAAERAGKVLMVGHNQRFDPRHRAIHDMIEQGRLGRPVMARADHFQNFNPPAGSWWRSKEKVGGGAVIGSGVHRLDLLRWFMGDVEEVYAAITFDPARLEAEAAAAATLRFRNGGIGEFFINWGVQRPVFCESLGVWGADRSVTIRGDDDPGQIGEAPWVLAPLDAPKTQTMWEHFHHCITTGAAPLTSGAEGRSALELVLAVVRSGETGKPIRLPP